ncbi:hypothetical protein [Pseudomonas fluorescens]|jgi:hypothetical protein|uniref:hypothetical protein n=1 Tax=Pseudomonas fluorescens TaxID=294 RepID=UPI000FB122D0|nr:hypothetical protein [Pseudomonas fluorescens]CAG8867740.1 hypothetical protein PS861_02160 [Pseudomonas fluorescens]
MTTLTHFSKLTHTAQIPNVIDCDTQCLDMEGQVSLSVAIHRASDRVMGWNFSDCSSMPTSVMQAINCALNNKMFRGKSTSCRIVVDSSVDFKIPQALRRLDLEVHIRHPSDLGYTAHLERFFRAVNHNLADGSFARRAGQPTISPLSLTKLRMSFENWLTDYHRLLSKGRTPRQAYAELSICETQASPTDGKQDLAAHRNQARRRQWPSVIQTAPANSSSEYGTHRSTKRAASIQATEAAPNNHDTPFEPVNRGRKP